MKRYIAFGSHKDCTLAEREDHRTGRTQKHRIGHNRGAIRSYLSCTKQTGTVSRPGSDEQVDPARRQRVDVMSPAVDSGNECDSPPEQFHAPLRAKR